MKRLRSLTHAEIKMKVLNVILFCILSANYAQAQYRTCLSPNQVTGYCVNILQCPTLYSVLQNPNLSQSVKQFMKDSRCGTASDSRPLVCCTGDTDYARNQRENDFEYDWDEPAPRQNSPFFPIQQQNRLPWSFGNEQSIDRSFVQTADGSSLLPQPPTCGGLTVQHRIYGGEDTELNEFPWMALMEYRRNSGNGLATSCAGSLINQRYILTAAHCLTGRIERDIGTLVSVLLGEYDTRTAVDCPKSGGACAPSAQRYGIAEIRAHELYKASSPNQMHDIGLVRLDRNVRYTENVRPICLPSVVGPEGRKVGQQFTVAGWGRTLQANRSPIKQKLTVNYVEPNQCRQKFAQRKIEIVPTQLCAGGKFRQDSCDGDSGGPLMRFRDNSWVLEGIVSFGYKCGLKDWPGVYSSVTAYDIWIKQNIRA